MLIQEMNFKAYFTNNEYPLYFKAYTWEIALSIALNHQSMTQKLIKIEKEKF